MNLVFEGYVGGKLYKYCIPVDSITDVYGDEKMTFVHFIRSQNIDGMTISVNVNINDFLTFKQDASTACQPGGNYSFEKWKSDTEFRKKCNF